MRGSFRVPAGHRINFHTSASVDKVARQFMYFSTDLSIPPHSTVTYEDAFRFDGDTMVFGLNRHTHRLGTQFDVYFYGGARDGELVFTSYDWEHDTDYTFPVPGVLMHYGEGFRWVCHYDNPYDTEVGWGENATDEMCILFGLQYDPNGGVVIP